MAKHREEREEWKGRGCCGHGGMGKLVVGLFLFVIGLAWLGNEMGWWSANVPWLPLLVTLIGLKFLVKWFMHRE